MSTSVEQSLPEAAAGAKPKSEEPGDFLRFLVKLVIAVTILRSLIFAPFSIPSESMLPRLLVGDYLIVTKWNYGYSKHSLPFSVPLIPGRLFSSLPDRGDVAVFKAPPGNDVDYIKRVIGLPGDRIQMRAGQLFINDKPVPKVRAGDFVVPASPNTTCNGGLFSEVSSDGKLRCRYPRYRETLPNGKSYFVLDTDPAAPRDDTEVYVVPTGHLFMMGDNRDGSSDSRYPAEVGGGVGYVPVVNLVGKAQFTMFSTDGSAKWYNPISWFTAARGKRIGEGF